MNPRDRRLLVALALIVLGALLAGFVVYSLWAAERRFDKSEEALARQDEELSALGVAYEAAVARDDELPTLEEIIGALADDVPTPLPGAPGEPGRDGRDGQDGADGRDGIDGQDGQDGAPGPPGESGPEGPVGPTGATGATGAQGETGATGATGATGPPGPQGEPGPAGPICPPGYTLTEIHIGQFDAVVCVLNP